MALPFYGMVITAFSPSARRHRFSTQVDSQPAHLGALPSTLAQAHWLVYRDGHNFTFALVA
jgi:hypothetical protein